MVSLDIVCRSIGSSLLCCPFAFFAVRSPSVLVSSFDVSFRLVLYVVVVLVVHTELHVLYRYCFCCSRLVMVEIPMTHWSLRSSTYCRTNVAMS